MRLRLDSKIAKIATIAVALVLLTPYGFVALERYRAASVAAKEDRASLERALQLQPNDADYHERLGRYMLFVEQDPPAALRHYEKAASLNQYSARNWLGVAQSQLILGNSPAALNAIDHALEVDPHTPSVAWETGNLLVTLGYPQRAMQQFRFTMANDPTMVGQGLQLGRRMEAPADAAKLALPPDPEIYIRFINMLLLSKDIVGAKQVWPELIALKRHLEPNQSFFYLATLLNAGDFDSATKAWSDLGKICPEVARLSRGDNVIHNASFEFPVLNGGFDWILPGTSTPDPVLQNDVSNAHEGARSLMATFDGGRPPELGLYQLFVLDPNSLYRFTGYIKADLQSANGLRFIIADINSGKRVLETEEVLESKAWREVGGTIRTGPEKHLYALRIVRNETTLIRGAAWVDDLQLVKVSE